MSEYHIFKKGLQLRNNSVTLFYIRLQNKTKGDRTMYTIDETGVMNNYATEPTVYFTEYPSPEQQRSYAFQGAAAFGFVALMLLTAFSVS
jgi:hypothetical protein